VEVEEAAGGTAIRVLGIQHCGQRHHLTQGTPEALLHLCFEFSQSGKSHRVSLCRAGIRRNIKRPFSRQENRHLYAGFSILIPLVRSLWLPVYHPSIALAILGTCLQTCGHCREISLHLSDYEPLKGETASSAAMKLVHTLVRLASLAVWYDSRGLVAGETQ